jgi:hypothetical protein
MTEVRKMEMEEMKKMMWEIGLEKVDEKEYVKYRVTKIKKLPDGRIAFTVMLGNPAKATSSLWAKKVKHVDTSKENGYAFEGEFFSKSGGKYTDTEIILGEGELAIAVVQDGTWKHKGQHMKIFVNLGGEIYTTSSGWETKADKIQTIHLVAEILNFLNSKNKR